MSNLTNYLIDTCQEYGYGFISNGKGDFTCVLLEDASKKVSSVWTLCEINAACTAVITQLINKEGTIRLVEFCGEFYESLWNKCGNESEAMLQLFIRYIVNLDYDAFELINHSKNEQYINKVVNLAYRLHSEKNSYHDSLNPLLELSVNNKVSLSLENLVLSCQSNKDTLHKLSNQNILKDYVEGYSPQYVENLKQYWTRIDQGLINNAQAILEEPCRVISFDKTYIYNLSLGKDVQFFEQRLKAINTFLNKRKIKKLLGIERSVFDGNQINQTKYRYFIIYDQNNRSIKTLLTKFVIAVLSSNEENQIDMDTILNYYLLQEKLPHSTSKIVVTKI